jgi:hypothetical protein
LSYVSLSARLFLAFVCLVAAGGKLAGRGGYREFREFVRQVGVPYGVAGPVAAATLAAELATAMLLPWPATGVIGAGLAAVVFSAFTVAVGVAARRGSAPRCFCFGRLGLPLGRLHVARNAVLSAVAFAALGLTVLVGDPARLGAGTLAAAAAAVLGAVLIVFWEDLASLSDAPLVAPSSARAE